METEMEMEAEEFSKIRDFHLAINRPQIIRFRRIWYRRTRIDLLYPILNATQAFA